LELDVETDKRLELAERVAVPTCHLSVKLRDLLSECELEQVGRAACAAQGKGRDGQRRQRQEEG
jgi:hypothetical protein